MRRGFQGRVEVRGQSISKTPTYSPNTANQSNIVPSFIKSSNFTFNPNNLVDILTKTNKINIDCFKPIISVDSTLTHVRYYLDDPVHLLVSCAELQRCDCNSVHQVFGAVAGDCSSLDN